MSHRHPIALFVPCLNEEVTIAKVISDFKSQCEGLAVYVIDNGSTDNTKAVAEAAGAIVIAEPRRGKGHAVRRAFAQIDAAIYIMVDGDDTYDAAAAPAMIKRLQDDRLDMVVGIRKHENDGAYRTGHQLGNRLFNSLFRRLFGDQFSDIFSGYRVFSRAFAKSFPARSSGFEIETELSVHCADLLLPTAEIPTFYGERPDGSQSKLNTYFDGFRILRKMIQLLRQNKPMVFYGCGGLVAAIIAVIFGLPVAFTYFETGLVPRFPTLIVAVGLLLGASLSFVTGIILQTMLSFQAENRHLAYLALGRDREKD